MSNQLITASVIAKRSLMAFKNKMGFIRGIDRQYSKEFAITGAKAGASITIRKPWRPTVSSGPTLNIQNVSDDSTTMTLDQQKHVDFQFSSVDRTLTVDQFSDRYVDPAISALANTVDVAGTQLAAQTVWNAVGTPGTTPNTFLLYLQAQQKLNENAAPMDGKRSIFINPAAQSTIVDALKGLFQSSTQISEQYESGMMGRAAGADWYMSQNIYSSTTGVQGGTPLVDGAGQTGASLLTKGWSNSITSVVRKGDVFTIAGIYSVNPITKLSTGALQQFLVTATTNSGASTGPATIAISPSIVTSGTLQTVTASPADSAAITVVGATNTTTVNNLLVHKDAFTLGTADLVKPEGVDFAATASDDESGLSVRVVRNYDINNDMFPCRIDILYGLAALRPEWACRILG